MHHRARTIDPSVLIFDKKVEVGEGNGGESRQGN